MSEHGQPSGDGLGAVPPQPLPQYPVAGPVAPVPGLPVVPGVNPPGYRPEDRLNLTGGWSAEKRTGAWTLPPFLRVQAIASTVVLDCRQARVTSPIVDIEVGAGAGSVVVILPPGWAVNVDRLGKGMGSIKVSVPREPEPGCPVLVFHGGMGLGSLRARPEKWWDRRR